MRRTGEGDPLAKQEHRDMISDECHWRSIKQVKYVTAHASSSFVGSLLLRSLHLLDARAIVREGGLLLLLSVYLRCSVTDINISKPNIPDSKEQSSSTSQITHRVSQQTQSLQLIMSNPTPSGSALTRLQEVGKSYRAAFEYNRNTLATEYQETWDQLLKTAERPDVTEAELRTLIEAVEKKIQALEADTRAHGSTEAQLEQENIMSELSPEDKIDTNLGDISPATASGHTRVRFEEAFASYLRA